MTTDNLAADFTSALAPPPALPPEPGPIPRENVRLLIRMLGYDDTDSVREVAITPTRILVQHVALNDAGAITLSNGEVNYAVAEHPITDA